ncbi:MAG TPA: DUF3168 domain-containing protein [Brevundimonas sp.]|nr:DUF3168 domain-containing protein [Brevundimonas sp.]
MSHELALQKALLTHLREDAALQALLGSPARITETAAPPGELPHLLIGRSESRPVRADGGGVEHVLTLTAVSRFRGSEEAKAIVAAVNARVSDAVVEADGVRTVGLRVAFSDVFPAVDGHRTFAVLRVRAVTEEIGS